VGIHDLDIFRTHRSPSKADPPLIIDADAVLANSVALERFQTVSRWNPQIFEAACDLELSQFAAGYRSDVDEPADALTAGKCFSSCASERNDHGR
jgi:hypothetical protein